jgi:hypothetical protein
VPAYCSLSKQIEAIFGTARENLPVIYQMGFLRTPEHQKGCNRSCPIFHPYFGNLDLAHPLYHTAGNLEQVAIAL